MTSQPAADLTKQWLNDLRLVTENLGVLFADLGALCETAPSVDYLAEWVPVMHYVQEARLLALAVLVAPGTGQHLSKCLQELGCTDVH